MYKLSTTYDLAYSLTFSSHHHSSLQSFQLKLSSCEGDIFSKLVGMFFFLIAECSARSGSMCVDEVHTAQSRSVHV